VPISTINCHEHKWHKWDSILTSLVWNVSTNDKWLGDQPTIVINNTHPFKRPFVQDYSNRKQSIAVCNHAHHYGISCIGSQCDLLPSRGDILAFIPSQLRLVFDLATLKGCKAELTQLAWLHIEVIYLPEDSHPSQ